MSRTLSGKAQHKAMNRTSYNTIATTWDSARSTWSGMEQRFVDTFLAEIVAPSPILDLGCGTGRPIGEYLLSRGYSLTGIDQAANLLQFARSRFPQARWIESRIEDLEDVAGSEQFAGIICWDALFHIERSAHAAILRTMAALLRPNGRIMLTIGGSDHPAFTDTMFGQPFFYDSHPPEIVVQIIEQIGFQIIAAEFLDKPTSGRDKGRYVIVAGV
jgi:2-polyprenyl-3-methyl-5-hydroxy-6-metoxy-1,4-benzoquinol methylase